MAVELYIEDEQVDLTGTEGISIDYAIAPIGDIQTRTGAKSIQFALPKTARNRAILENPDDVTNLSQIPYTKLKARLYVDGVDVRIVFAQLENTTDVYNLRLYGENVGLFDSMKATRLWELSFCAYDHFWNFATVVASRNNNDGYVYPIIDNNADSPNAVIDNAARQVDTRNLLPAVFVHTVFDAMAAYFGITINNLVEQAANFPVDKLILPFSRSEYRKSRNPERYEVKFITDTDIELDTPASGLNSNLTTGVIMEFDNREGCSSYWDKIPVYEPTEVQFAEVVTATVEYSFILEADPIIGGGFDVEVLITPVYSKLVAGTAVDGVDFIQVTVSLPLTGSATTTGSFTFTTSSTEQYPNGLIMAVLQPPDTVILKAGSYARIKDIEIIEGGEISYSISSVVANFVTVASALPDWNCAELLKQYCLMFGAVLSYNEFSKTLSIVPFYQIKNNIGSALDWSDKLDFTQAHQIDTRLGSYGQVNTLAYNDSDEVVKPDGTDYEFTIADATLPATYEMITLDFGATETVTRLIGITVLQIKNFDNDGVDLEGVSTPRILVLREVESGDYPDTSDIVYVDGTSTSVGITNIALPYFIESGQAFNLGFRDNLSDTYYADLEDVLSRAKIATVLLRLNASDINQLDFTKPVYIKHFNAYFYINKISAYTPTSNESTKVELVKLF
jgi:hypothetical protein